MSTRDPILGNREPKWTSGAYSRSPVFEPGTGIEAQAFANIECWRGNVDELVDPVATLVRAVAGNSNAQIKATITWGDSTQDRVADVAALRERLNTYESPVVLGIRVDTSSPDARLVGQIIIGAVIPGVRVKVQGLDRTEVLAVTEMVYRRMMIGYVDRLGGWRVSVWMAWSLAPILLVSIAISPGEASPVARAVVAVVALGSAFTAGLMSYSRLLIAVPLVLLPLEGTARATRASARLAQWWHNRWIRIGFVTAWTLAVGVMGNKIAGLLPWP